MEGKVFKRKRVVSLLLALCMALTLLPGTAWAEETENPPAESTGAPQITLIEPQGADAMYHIYTRQGHWGEFRQNSLEFDVEVTGAEFAVGTANEGALSSANWVVTYGDMVLASDKRTSDLLIYKVDGSSSKIRLDLRYKVPETGDKVTIKALSGAFTDGTQDSNVVEYTFPTIDIPTNIRFGPTVNGFPSSIICEMKEQYTGNVRCYVSPIEPERGSSVYSPHKTPFDQRKFTFSASSEPGKVTCTYPLLPVGWIEEKTGNALGTGTYNLQISLPGMLASYEELTWTANTGSTTPDPVTLSKIEVTTPPTKTSYQVNETFDKTGMVVTATYSDNTTAAVTDYTLSIGENAFTTAGETTITVTCQGKTASFQVNVTESSGSETITIKPTVTATPTRFDVGTTEVKVTLKSTDASFALHLDENMFIVDSGSTRLFLVSVAPARNPGNDGTVWCDAVLTFTDTSAFGGQGPAQAGELKITAKGSAFRSPNAATVMEDAAPVTITIGSSTSGGDNPPVNPNPPVIPDIPFIPSNPSAGNSGGSSNTTAKPSTPPDTVTNPDGSTTTTKTDNATGTVTETTKETDGSLTVVETKTNGTVTTTATDPAGNKTATVENPNGSTVTIIENKDGGASTTTVSTSGQVTAVVTAPAAAVAAAQSGGQAVALPMPEVPLTANTAAAPVVTVTTGSSQPVKVEIPVERTTPGTVAVIVNANGTETVVKTSLASGNGVTLTVPDGATVKIVDNSKSFADTVSHWAGDAITFATAHELFNGTGADSFTPNGTMTRGMLVTVLARYDGVDTASGATWYEKGVEWAAANNISSGADLDAPVSREQLATMLYRYAAFSGLDTTASGALTGFADAGSVSGYAADAMAWAVGMGLIGGTDKGELDPKGSATRAEVAAILMRFCENVMK